MTTKIKIITAGDFLEVTPEGVINIATSRQLLIDIAKAEHPPADYELLVDFRNTECDLSVPDVYQLAAELGRYGDVFRRKVALLVPPGLDFDRASFFETCSHNRGFQVDAFTDYEKAMRWVLSAEEPPDSKVLPKKAKPACRSDRLSAVRGSRRERGKASVTVWSRRVRPALRAGRGHRVAAAVLPLDPSLTPYADDGSLLDKRLSAAIECPQR